MRITGGELCGRRLKVPRADVRPTQDRVREALFSIIGDEIFGAVFLDLFAGSGSVGLEAWSRGAERVCWVEEGRAVLKVLKGNVEELCDSGAAVVAGDALRVMRRGLREGPFDIVFADPPYEYRMRESRPGESSVLQAIAEQLDESGLLKEDGLFVFEQRARNDAAVPEGWELIKEKVYGQAKLLFFRRR